MAFINLLHNGYQGKLGETVGQKWKNQRMVRTYNPHNTSRSQYQADVRNSYKKIIGIASDCYPYLFGAQYVNPKNRNRFNAFTSAMHKIYYSKQDEIMETGVFKNHTGTQFKPQVAYSNRHTFIFFDDRINPLISNIEKLKVVGILVKETPATVEPPTIDTLITQAFYAPYLIMQGQVRGDYGVVFQIAGWREDVKGSIVQFSFKFHGKECIQKPIVIGDLPSESWISTPKYGEKKFLQTF